MTTKPKTPKPQLQAMIEAASVMSDQPSKIREIFFSALHWRGDELWCGPFAVGSIWSSESDGEVFHFGGFGGSGGRCGDWKSETQARTALMSAAAQQINKWFEE